MIHHALNQYFLLTSDTPKGLAEKSGVPLSTIYRLRKSGCDCNLRTYRKLEPFLWKFLLTQEVPHA